MAWFDTGGAPPEQIDMDRLDRPCEGCFRSTCPDACVYISPDHAAL